MVELGELAKVHAPDPEDGEGPVFPGQLGEAEGRVLRDQTVEGISSATPNQIARQIRKARGKEQKR